ncbi:MAG: hypothetical protein Q8O67_08725 [Deltaproteobacteria bacterium]|nr:hypothetical protein [Deltaproteobacteria bacterium]
MRRAAVVVVLCCFFLAAREQCIPGPFVYEGDPTQFNDGPIDAVQCAGDADCQNRFGPDSRCQDGVCGSGGGQLGTPCQLGTPDSCDFVGPNQGCVFDPDGERPVDQGVCAPFSADAAGLGEPCELRGTEENTCAGDAFCLPTDPAAINGLCVLACTGGAQQECPAGLACTLPFANPDPFAEIRPLCMPACDLIDLDCPTAGGDFVCQLPEGVGQPSCTRGEGACVLASCTALEECAPLCSGGGACPASTFCIETVVESCLFQGPEQRFSSCAPPAEQNQPCLITEPNSCVEGLACSPFNSPDGKPSCVQQSATPIDDELPCTSPGLNANVCRPGSYCATSDGSTGICQRFCDDGDDCEAGFSCQRANLVGRAGPEGGPIDDLRVCAAACTDSSSCPSGFACDVDGASCFSPGFCLPRENGSNCAFDGICNFPTGAICSGDDVCTLPEDACLAETCTLSDPSSCPNGFACSPFQEPPECVELTPSPIAEGGDCNSTEDPVQCEAGTYCASDTVCQRFCDSAGDCTPPQQCVRGNVFSNTGADLFRFFDIQVCADPCASDANCGAPGLFCDRDAGETCGGNGFCLPREPTFFGCSTDADCDTHPGTACDTALTGACLPIQDICE